MVVLVGSVPASAEPRRIEKNGTAITIITSAATPATSAGRRRTHAVQRAHTGDSALSVKSPAFRRRRSRRPGTRPPRMPSSAGSSDSAASIVKATVTAAATATPYRKLTPRANIPSIAMQTIVPANSTARPEVSIASTAESSRDRPRFRACL